MKTRILILSALALAFLSWDASAQASIFVPKYSGRQCSRTAQAPVNYGSVARTKLLTRTRGAASTPEALSYGSADRRAYLTTGRTAYPPRKAWFFGYRGLRRGR